MQNLYRRVEHVDTDAAGVVHFTRYASLLETAAVENLERLGVGVRDLRDEDLDLVATRLQMRYSAPARFFDLLRVEVRVDRVGGASFHVSGTVHLADADPEAPLASGSLVLCAVDRSSGSAVALPRRMRRVLHDCLNGEDHG